MSMTLFNPAYRRAQQDRRFSMTPEQYLTKHNIPEYLADAVRLLAESNDADPLGFLSAYFANILSGENVIFRDFAYIQMTARNRRSFIRHVCDTYQNFDQSEEITPESLHQLFCLICPDFPFEYVSCGHHICSLSQTSCSDSYPNKGGGLPFSQLLHYSSLFLFFSDFLRICAKEFVSANGETSEVDCTVIYGSILEASKKFDSLIVPDQAVLTDILCRNADELPQLMSFDDFVKALFNHKDIANALVEPRSYAELRESIERLLKSLSLDKNLTQARSKRKVRRNDKRTN